MPIHLSSGCSSFLPTFLCLCCITFFICLENSIYYFFQCTPASVLFFQFLFVWSMFIFHFVLWRVENSTLAIFFRVLMMSFYFFWLPLFLLRMQQSDYCSLPTFFLRLLLIFFSLSLHFITLLCCIYVQFSCTYLSCLKFLTLYETLYEFELENSSTS